VGTLIKEEFIMLDNNRLEGIRIKDIENDVPFTVYFGYDGTQYIIHRDRDSIDFESEPMEVTLTINYRQKTRIFKNAFTNIDTEDKYVLVDAFNIKMGMHNKHIDVELENTLWGRKDTHRKMYLWGGTCDISLYSIYPLRYIMEKCYYILDKMDFTNIMLFVELTKDTMIFRKSIIHGIITSENQELAEICLDCLRGNDIAFLWDDVKQEFFDTNFPAICILIEELVENNRPELLRMIPLRLRILLVTHFNAEGKHEIVAALNYYHRGDYRNPGEDLVL
jgi:hypothetical protein